MASEAMTWTTTDKMRIKIDGSLTDCFKENTNRLFSEHISTSDTFGSDVEFNKRNMLTLGHDKYKEIFQPTCEGIKQLILRMIHEQQRHLNHEFERQELLQRLEQHEHLKHMYEEQGQLTVFGEQDHLDQVVLVGGFACSDYLFNVVKETFSETSVNVIRPGDPDLVVLKGAVLFGHHPERICARVSKYTYGTDYMLPFEEGIDPQELAWIEKGRKFCRKRFSIHVRMGEIFKYDSFSEIQKYEVHVGYNTITFGIFSSKKGNPRYIVDEETHETECLGEITVPIEDSWQEQRFIDIKIKYGDTRLKVETEDSVTGRNIVAGISCLT